MSGTSADGIEAVAAEVHPARGSARLLAGRHSRYDDRLRGDVLAAGAGTPLSAHGIATLHARLGDAYADAVDDLLAAVGMRPDVIALHGQTIAHYPGLRVTLQIGDAARVAVRTGVPVVCDFRSATSWDWRRWTPAGAKLASRVGVCCSIVFPAAPRGFN